MITIGLLFKIIGTFNHFDSLVFYISAAIIGLAGAITWVIVNKKS